MSAERKGKVKADLLPTEVALLGMLANAWNLWCRQPDRLPGDDADFERAIHDAQRMVALRVARRADPDVWRKGND